MIAVFVCSPACRGSDGRQRVSSTLCEQALDDMEMECQDRVLHTVDDSEVGMEATS